MPKLVISTVGTSLLTNQIEFGFDPDAWEHQLLETVNASEQDIQTYHSEMQSVLEKLRTRAVRTLETNDIVQRRAASAELNGIYGLYRDDLTQSGDDAHLLIATDTAQGQITSVILENFLRQQGLGNTSILTADDLSISSSRTFSQGIAKLLPTLQETIQQYRDSKYQVCFNLVGGFKALQGFFNVIGMFYADEMIYIFEGSNELISIPKLPVKIDSEQVEPYKVPLAMMNAGEIRVSWEAAKKVPPEWVDEIDQEMILSTWGQLVWNQSKNSLLQGDNLLDLPKLVYEPTFKRDYKNQTDNSLRIDLQETLAKVSQILHLKQDGIGALKQDGGIQYSQYNALIDHFRVSRGLRVSCKVLDGGRLSLRYYGTHDYVQGNEGVR